MAESPPQLAHALLSLDSHDFIRGTCAVYQQGQQGLTLWGLPAGWEDSLEEGEGLRAV